MSVTSVPLCDPESVIVTPGTPGVVEVAYLTGDLVDEAADEVRDRSVVALVNERVSGVNARPAMLGVTV